MSTERRTEYDVAMSRGFIPDPDPLYVEEDPEPRTYSTNPVTSGVWFLAGLLVAIAVLVAYALAKGGAR